MNRSLLRDLHLAADGHMLVSAVEVIGQALGLVEFEGAGES